MPPLAFAMMMWGWRKQSRPQLMFLDAFAWQAGSLLQAPFLPTSSRVVLCPYPGVSQYPVPSTWVFPSTNQATLAGSPRPPNPPSSLFAFPRILTFWPTSSLPPLTACTQGKLFASNWGRLAPAECWRIGLIGADLIHHWSGRSSATKKSGKLSTIS